MGFINQTVVICENCGESYVLTVPDKVCKRCQMGNVDYRIND